MELLDDGSNGLKTDPPRKRGRPRKVPISAESLSVSNIVNAAVPSKRQRGRPRKIPVNTDTLDYVGAGEELGKEKLVPVLGVADAHDENKSPLRQTVGKPANTPEQTEEVNHLDGGKNLNNPGISSCNGIDNLNGKPTLMPCKSRGRPRKNPVRIEDACTNVVEDGTANSSSLRKSRGRPRRIPDKKSDVGDSCIIEDLTSIECVFTPSVNVSNIESKSSPPKKRREKLKRGPDESLSDASGDEPTYSGQKELPLVLTDGEVSCLAENAGLRKELHDLHRTDSFANASSDILQECRTDEEISAADNGNPCPERNSKASVTTANDSFGAYPSFLVKDMEAVGRHTQAVPVFYKDAVSASSNEVVSKEFIEDDIISLNAQEDVALPRVVLCLGHNGKVAWDIKWRPRNDGDANLRHRLGYLAAVLGNGSLEV